MQRPDPHSQLCKGALLILQPAIQVDYTQTFWTLAAPAICLHCSEAIQTQKNLHPLASCDIGHKTDG